jgi:cell division protease FtsH
MKNVPLAADVDVKVIARGTPGFSGADLANLVNEAALQAARANKKLVAMYDFEFAKDKVLMGAERRSMIVTDEEKKITAIHEAGHALLSVLLPLAEPIHKVTIIPRGMALGVTMQLPVDDKHNYSRPYLMDQIAILLGGRIAEELTTGEITTGAGNDLERATELARRMICEWGMSDRIGPMAWGSEGAVFLGEDLVHTRDYSDETARVIDEEVERILRDEEGRTRATLTEHRPGLVAVAEALLERETVDGEEVADLVDSAMGYKSGGPRRALRADGTEEVVETSGDGDSFSDFVE